MNNVSGTNSPRSYISPTEKFKGPDPAQKQDAEIRELTTASGKPTERPEPPPRRKRAEPEPPKEAPKHQPSRRVDVKA